MTNHKCNDFGKQAEQLERMKDGSIKVWLVTTCSICGTITARDLINTIYP